MERYGLGGQPVVLLHGFGTSSFVWRHVAAALARAGYTAFAVDLLGHGESDRPFDADYSIASQVEYVHHALTAMRVARVTMVGLDLGAAIALRMAIVRAERVERLVLVNPIAFDAIPADDIRSLHRNTARFAIRANRGVLGVAPMLTPLLEGSVADPEHMPPRLVGRYLAPFVGRDGVAHLLALSRAVSADDLLPLDFTHVRAPTLILRGTEDRWVGAGVSERLAEVIPNARLEPVPETARLIPEEAPALLAERIAWFAARGRATAARAGTADAEPG